MTFARRALAGPLAAGAVGYAAYRAHALDAGGAVAAAAVGGATYAGLGMPGAAVLLAFFTTSVGLSRLGRARKRAVLVDVGKTGARDTAQVLANGGAAAACALLAAGGSRRAAFAFAGAFAAATADTWATEVGTLARRPPRSIVGFAPIAAGLSGGVTLPGTLAEVAGAALLATAALALRGAPPAPSGPAPDGSGYRTQARLWLATFVAGVAGSTVDSLLGATLQATRRCPRCERATETDPHVCGSPTVHLRGLRWLGNDAVNAAATLAGAAVAAAFA